MPYAELFQELASLPPFYASAQSSLDVLHPREREGGRERERERVRVNFYTHNNM